jgi:hypothetical protein
MCACGPAARPGAGAGSLAGASPVPGGRVLPAGAAQVLMDVYGKLVKADEFIGVSASEVYFRTLRGCARSAAVRPTRRPPPRAARRAGRPGPRPALRDRLAALRPMRMPSNGLTRVRSQAVRVQRCAAGTGPASPRLRAASCCRGRRARARASGARRARRRWCFLPFIPGLCLRRDSTWRLPQREMHALATSIRKVARVLWAVHVTFQEVRQPPRAAPRAAGGARFMVAAPSGATRASRALVRVRRRRRWRHAPASARDRPSHPGAEQAVPQTVGGPCSGL